MAEDYGEAQLQALKAGLLAATALALLSLASTRNLPSTVGAGSSPGGSAEGEPVEVA